MRIYRLTVFTGFIGLSMMLGFNCSQSGFETGGNLDLSSTQMVGTKVDESYQLLNHQQILHSMLSATGVDNLKTSNDINNEFLRREGAFDISGSVKMINAPMVLSQANLASEICNQLVVKERALTTGERIIFSSVDFTKPPTAVTPDQISVVTQNLSRNSWRRPASEVETQLIQSSTLDFMNDFTAAEKASANQTTTVGVYVCTAILSSFDAMTY